jgi:hypothetical protein
MYVWDDEAGSLRIELALAVVERLSFEAMEAFKSVPRRGLEVGGLLLGESRTGLIRIEDCAEVPSEHRSGPSYRLSPADLEMLDRSYGDHPEAVGMYRTATQAETLALHEDDATLFERHFSGRPGVFLLVHPATRTGAFCLPAADGLVVAHEFPFHAADLGARLPEPEPEPAPEWATFVATPASVPGAAGSKTGAPARISRSRLWSARAGALVLGGVIGALAWRYIQPVAPRVGAAIPAQPSPIQTAGSDPAHIVLEVMRDGRTLRLHWDQGAPAIRKADHALLHIVDGNHQTNLNLTPNELNNGSLSYWADTPDVSFRLEVFGPGIKTDDSVRAVSGASEAQPPLPPAAAPMTTEASLRRWPRAGQSNRDPEELNEGTASSAAAPEPRPSPFVPPPKPAPAPPEAVAMPAPHPPATPATVAAPPARTGPHVEVSAEPVLGSRFGRMVRHVPLLRRLRKEPEETPPEPVREMKPSLSDAEQHNLTADVPIDVRVYVTESGSVNFAELLASRPASRHRDLADAAVFAARRWSFRPAKAGEENVPSEVVLHFLFRPSDGPQ